MQYSECKQIFPATQEGGGGRVEDARAEGLFDPSLYFATRRPLLEATTLPAHCYTSQAWFERERERIFHRHWLCAGRVEQVAAVGQYFSVDIAGTPVIVVRAAEDRINALVAVCRHRAAVLGNESGQCRRFVCPYHSWSYDLDGELKATPGKPAPMAMTRDFDMADNHLVRLRVSIWGGFIFVNFNPEAESFESSHPGLVDLTRNYPLDEMQLTRTDRFEVDCNWKVWLENAFENYHSATVHRKHVDHKNPAVWTFEDSDGSFEAFYSARSLVKYDNFPSFAKLNGKEAAGLYHVWVAPTLQLILASTYVKFRQYFPVSAGKLKLAENWLFHRDAARQPSFDEEVQAKYYAKYGEIITEDALIAPNVQRGLTSGAYRPGRYSHEEYIVHRIGNWVLDQCL